MEVVVRVQSHRVIATGGAGKGLAFCNCGWRHEGVDAVNEGRGHETRRKGGWVTLVGYRPGVIFLEMKHTEFRYSDHYSARMMFSVMAEQRLASQTRKPQSLLNITTA